MTFEYNDSNEFSALEIIYEYVKDIKQAHVCLSGGVDSQFWIRVCEHFDIPYTASTYLTTWEGSPINTEDYVCAQLTAKKFNCKWDTIEIDLQEFYNSDRPYELAKKYKTDSQQICLHLEYLSLIKDRYADTTFLMGGDAMYLQMVTADGGPDILGLNGHRLKDLLVYENFFKQNSIEYVKDIVYLDAKMPSQIFKLNIEFVKQHKQHLSVDTNDSQSHQMENLPVKSFLWESILPGTVNTLIKVGGFERVKKYFAMKTGIYNYFDKKYREPLEQLMKNDNDMIQDPSKVKIIVKNKLDMHHYIEEFDSTVKEVDSKPLTLYLFDF